MMGVGDWGWVDGGEVGNWWGYGEMGKWRGGMNGGRGGEWGFLKGDVEICGLMKSAVDFVFS